MVHYTHKDDVVYAICLAWPGKNAESRSSGHYRTNANRDARPMAKCLTWKPTGAGLVVDVPLLSETELPCRNAWVFKLTGLKTTA